MVQQHAVKFCTLLPHADVPHGAHPMPQVAVVPVISYTNVVPFKRVEFGGNFPASKRT